MAEKLNIPMWLQRIQRAEDLQSTKSEERRQILKLLLGTFFGKPTDNTTDLSEVNFVYEYLKVLVAAIYAQNPFIFAKSISRKWWKFAENMQIVLNRYWTDKNVKEKIKSAIVEGVMFPPGWVSIGFTALIEKNEGDIFPEVKKTKAETEAQQGIMDETIKNEDVFISHVPSWNMLWPDGYNKIRTSPYIIERQELPLIDIINNPIYKESKHQLRKTREFAEAKKKIKPFTVKADIPIISDVTDIDLELAKITLYHVWDKRSNQRFTLAKNFVDDTLFGPKKWNYFIDGFPYYDLVFNPIPQTLESANSYPLSDIVPMLPQLKELSLISSAMLRHRKRAGTLILAKKGAILPPDIAKIQRAQDVAIVEADNISEQALKGFTPPALPNDFYKLREVILQDLLRVSGFQQLLFSAKGIETATESENVRAGALLRQSEKIDIIEDFTVMIARGLAGLIWQFLPRKKIEEIVGEELDEEMWPSVPGDPEEARRLIQEELSYRIDAGSTRPPKDQAIEVKQWGDLAGQIRANFPHRIKEDAFLKQWLKKNDAKDIDDLVISFDEEEIATAQEENQLLMKNIPQAVGPNENHMLHLQVHSQVLQTPGMVPTKEMDEHIVKHSDFLERQSPTASPQRGDSKVAPRSTTPEIARKGVGTSQDIMGSIKNIPGVGGEKGRAG